MERLTEHVGDSIRIKGCTTLYPNKERKGAPLNNAIVRLCALEDAEEQGLLVRLPCRVGDTVYYIGRNRIDDVQVESIHCWISGMWKVSGRRGTGRFYAGYEFFFEDFGKTVFPTRDEAEAALKEANQNG